jgi:hypothetical protein
MNEMKTCRWNVLHVNSIAAAYIAALSFSLGRHIDKRSDQVGAKMREACSLLRDGCPNAPLDLSSCRD